MKLKKKSNKNKWLFKTKKIHTNDTLKVHMVGVMNEKISILNIWFHHD